jgi:kynurenine formamidase
MPHDRLPSYRELPVRDGAPPGSSWGLWGDDDDIGALNLLTDERTLAAARTITRGAVFPLCLPLHELDPHLAWRTPPRHEILHVGHETRSNAPGGTDDPTTGLIDRDDYLDGVWLQGGTQWDGLSHVRHPEHGNYNGVADADIHGGPGTRLGIDRWAARAIVGRGVLLDAARHFARVGADFDPTEAVEITVDDLEQIAAEQDVTLGAGDVLLLHTGWMRRYLDASPDERARLIAWKTLTSAGLQPSQEMVEYLWDTHIAAVAADNAGVEAMSPNPQFFLHLHTLPLLGIPLGEFWALHDLAADCAADGRYSFLLVSVPWNVRGAVGSPPQAIAIK